MNTRELESALKYAIKNELDAYPAGTTESNPEYYQKVGQEYTNLYLVKLDDVWYNCADSEEIIEVNNDVQESDDPERFVYYQSFSFSFAESHQIEEYFTLKTQ